MNPASTAHAHPPPPRAPLHSSSSKQTPSSSSSSSSSPSSYSSSSSSPSPPSSSSARTNSSATPAASASNATDYSQSQASTRGASASPLQRATNPTSSSASSHSHSSVSAPKRVTFQTFSPNTSPLLNSHEESPPLEPQLLSSTQPLARRAIVTHHSSSNGHAALHHHPQPASSAPMSNTHQYSSLQQHPSPKLTSTAININGMHQINNLNGLASTSTYRGKQPHLQQQQFVSEPEFIDEEMEDARGLQKTASFTNPLPLLQAIVREMHLWSILRYIFIVALLLYLLRWAFHTYQDRNKVDTFTIVAVIRDFNELTARSVNDKMRHAFIATALHSWSNIVLGQNILIFTDNSDTCDYLAYQVREIRCQLVTCIHEDTRKPLLSCVFDSLPTLVRTPVFAFVTMADVSLDPLLPLAIATTQKRFAEQPWLIVGQKRSVEVRTGMLDEYEKQDYLPSLFAQARKGETVVPLYFTALIDLFVMPVSLLQNPNFRPFPAFISGVYRFDQWLLATCILNETIAVIDSSSSLLIVGQERIQPLAPSKAGIAYNDQLVKSISGNSYKIGRVENSDYLLIGTCPECELISNPNVTNQVLFTKRASKEGYLVVLTVNSGYTNLALNWVCWAKRIRFNNYILIAEDQNSAQKFRAHDCPVIVSKDAPVEKPAADYGSVAFQETMTFRTEFLMSVLQSGFHFVTADMDGLWLDDPIQYFNHNVDLQGQTHKETKISGGFVVVRATSYGRSFWQQVIDCQRDNAKFLATAKEGTYEPASYTEQYCVNELSHGLASQPLFSKALLDRYIFPDGRSFFDLKEPQYRGISPAVIHNNWIKGTGAKLARLEDWHLSSADEEKEICTELPSLARSTTLSSSSTITVLIRILARSNPAALSALLDSLSKVDFLTDKPRLEIDIDGGETQAAALTKIATEFAWPHGNVVINARKQHDGLLAQWRSWSADNENEVALFLDEEALLSPYMYKSLKPLLLRYYLEPSQYDHRLFGISLTAAGLIIGETYEQRWGTKLPSELIQSPSPSALTSISSYTSTTSSVPLFKYQLLSSTAQLLFPLHWKAFDDWLTETQKDRGFIPCVPTLISNQWYQEAENKDKMWTQWWHRFAFERGWYSLHFNLVDNSALVLAPITSQQGVESHLSDKQRASLISLYNPTSADDLAATLSTAPDVFTLPVYDFHFKLVNVPETLAWRQYLTPIKFFVDQCWTLDLLEKKLADDMAKLEQERVDKILKQQQLEAEKKAKAEAEKKQKKEEADAKKKEADAKKTAAKGAKDSKAKTTTAFASNSTSHTNVNATKAKAVVKKTNATSTATSTTSVAQNAAKAKSPTAVAAAAVKTNKTSIANATSTSKPKAKPAKDVKIVTRATPGKSSAKSVSSAPSSTPSTTESPTLPVQDASPSSKSASTPAAVATKEATAEKEEPTTIAPSESPASASNEQESPA